MDAISVALVGAGIAGLLRRRAAPAALAFALILSTMLAAPQPSRADNNDDFAIKAVSQTRLAYVVTGNADVDSIVKNRYSSIPARNIGSAISFWNDQDAARRASS